MKAKLSSLFVVLLIATTSVLAQSKTEKFKVYGNCGMCEKTIETAANAVKGVTSADWDKETKMIKVVLDESKTTVDKVHKAIAKVGYDTKLHKAKDEVYAKLPGCCQYERPAAKKKSKAHDHDHDHSGHNHSH
jgi:copper chaperone CopZ